MYLFSSVFDIIINYQIIQKEIKIKIGQLLTPIISKNEFIAYETNIKDISSLTSNYFNIKQNINCIFKKNINNEKLLLLCNATEEGIKTLGKINSNVFDKINALYKFVIEETENNEEFNVSDIGTKISSLYPLELNFKEKEKFIIKYETENPERLKGIKLNNESKFELNCENKIWFKECIINEEHFKNSENGYYYTYHSNHLGLKTVAYEAPAIKVILNESKSSNAVIIALIIISAIIVIILILFCLNHYLRKKNSIDFDIKKEVKDKDKSLNKIVSSYSDIKASD